MNRYLFVDAVPQKRKPQNDKNMLTKLKLELQYYSPYDGLIPMRVTPFEGELSCPDNQIYCDRITLHYDKHVFQNENSGRIEISLVNSKDILEGNMIQRLKLAVRTGNEQFVSHLSIIKYAFLFLSILTFFWHLKTRGNQLLVEHKYIFRLSVLQILFNDPFYFVASTSVGTLQ